MLLFGVFLLQPAYCFPQVVVGPHLLDRGSPMALREVVPRRYIPRLCVCLLTLSSLVCLMACYHSGSLIGEESTTKLLLSLWLLSPFSDFRRWKEVFRRILLTRLSQRRSLVSGDQWADHMPHGCSRLISISRRWEWARHLPGRWPDEGSWSTSGKWMQRRAAPAHAPIPDLTCSTGGEKIGRNEWM